MTEKQYDLLQRMEEEHAEYLDRLVTEDKRTIISSSDKTVFYAFMLERVRENELPRPALNALTKTDDPLFALYRCYMDNNEDYLEHVHSADRVLYQYAKEHKLQDQM